MNNQSYVSHSVQGDSALVDLDNARHDDQRDVMKQIMAEGVCPFCPDQLRRFHRSPILVETAFWIVTPNHWPYDHTKVHLLAISKPHWEQLDEVTPQAAAELFEIFGKLVQEHHYPGGGLAMRFGDTTYSGGTIKHLHAQFVVPDAESSDFQPVRIKIGKTPKK